MAETKKPDVVVWLRNESTRNYQLRAEKNEDGSWKHSAKRRSTFWRRGKMLNRAADLLDGHP